MRTADAIAAKATGVLRQRGKRVLKPRLPNLLESLVIVRATAHSIKVLWNDRVIRLRQREPIEVLGSRITRSCCDRDTHLRSSAAELLHRWQIPNNYIGSGG